jgi:hypothetical protein
MAAGQSSETPAPAATITKGYEYERGRYVTLAPEELCSIAPDALNIVSRSARPVRSTSGSIRGRDAGAPTAAMISTRRV